MRKVCIIFLLLLFFSPIPGICAFPDSIVYVLKVLDKRIAEKNTYRKEREYQIDLLRKQLSASVSAESRYGLCSELFIKYLHYQADSALTYIERKAAIIMDMHKPGNELYINRAEVMGVMGMYGEALRELEKVDRNALNVQSLLYYYNTCRACYGWMADYVSDPRFKELYNRKTSDYRDSILIYQQNKTDRDIVRAEQFLESCQSDSAVALLRPHLDDEQGMQQQAFLNYTLSEAYSQKQDTLQQIYYLANAAVCDITLAVREYASLQKLARLLYLSGDVERAYRYLSCSMEDAVACNARLRFMEVTAFYPIINKAYKEQESQKRMLTRWMLICVSGLALLLIAALAYLYYWMKKLSVMRRHLYAVNRKLVTANSRLEQTGKIKEVYIARYLDRCVVYLEKLEQYRRSLEKLAMASKIDELFKLIRSEQFLKDERKSFYNEFDKSFLDLFPSFIADFNHLLQEDCKVYPKSGELLNTELRIFALIRLGITDSSRIAHFLGYSLATVYNYRSKIRNRAKGDKDLFESEVMEL